jgi:hypothetical protein
MAARGRGRGRGHGRGAHESFIHSISSLKFGCDTIYPKAYGASRGSSAEYTMKPFTSHSNK